MKWEFAHRAPGDVKFIFCNADEGEPGTFKDRVILTELPQLVFEGMAIAGYAVGAQQGILYLRNEYHYLRAVPRAACWPEMREQNLLGSMIAGKSGFDFDIKIQYRRGRLRLRRGVGADRIRRGQARRTARPPAIPGRKGLSPEADGGQQRRDAVLGGPGHAQRPGVVQRAIGTKESKGTKVLSVSGDCERPGVYEVAWGFTVNDILTMVGATDVQAVQVGGPSGVLHRSGRVRPRARLRGPGDRRIAHRHRRAARPAAGTWS